MAFYPYRIALQIFLTVIINNVHPAASTSPQLFHHQNSHSSIVLGSYLYIHGGELTTWNGSGDGYGPTSNLVTLPSNHTYSIDLSVPWTNASVNLNAFTGDAPTLVNQALWADSSAASFYAYDGGLSYSLQLSQQPPPPPNQLWKFTPSGNAGNWATVNAPLQSNFSNLVRTYGGVYAFGDGLGFALGGAENAATGAKVGGQSIDLPGMVIYNISSQQWYNLSLAGYSRDGYAGGSGAHFVPRYGSAGLLLIFGGSSGNSTAPPDEVSIFDPISQNWEIQATSGNGPSSAYSGPCVVGIQGDNNTYEIFLFGGKDSSVDLTVAQGIVFVLSLPSFNWQKQEAIPTVGRFSHSCNIIGNSQMVSIGGKVTNSTEWNADIGDATPDESLPDPFPSGIGVFDMTAMQWVNSYNPNAAPYVTPNSVKAYNQQHGPYPPAWTNDIVKGWFTKSASANTSSTSQSQPAPPPPPPPQNTSAIVGGVIGGIAAVVVISLSTFFYLRHKNHKSRPAVSNTNPGYEKPELSNNVHTVNEVEGADRRFELPQKENAVGELDSEAQLHELLDNSRT